MSTKIEWATETWNPVTGCSKISEGCANCYAERIAKRLAGRFGYPPIVNEWYQEIGKPFDVTLHPDRLEQPLHWRKPRRVFVCSMGDLFHEDVHKTHFAEDVLDIIEQCPQHTFLMLTKRPENMKVWIEWKTGFGRTYPNLWLGVTAENQARADERIPILLQIPAAVRFVSVEPCLEAIDLGLFGTVPHSSPYALVYERLNWAIVGCETGPSPRPMSLDWARSLRDQCQAAGVPFFFKRNSNGSRTLDGVMWEQYPEVQ